MSYKWQDNADGGSDQPTKIPAGSGIRVRIDRIIYNKKGAGPFKSRNGDPQIMVVFVDDQDREAGQMFTLSDKAGWTLARLLSRFGVDVAALEADGIEPRHFESKAVADRYLLGLVGRVDVAWIKGNDGKDYAEVTPCKVEGDTPPKVQPKRQPPPQSNGSDLTEDDIPF